MTRAPVLEPTMTTPFGTAERCQARNRAGKQCGKASRVGYRVCSHHGVGTRKRVVEGTRQLPALAPMVQQGVLTPHMLALYAETSPDYATRIRDWSARDDAELYDYRDLVVHLRAAVDFISERAPRMAENKLGEPVPPPIVGVLKTLSEALVRCGQLEEQRRRAQGASVTPLQLRAFAKVVVEIVGDYVPAEHRERVMGKLRTIARLGYGAGAGLATADEASRTD